MPQGIVDGRLQISQLLTGVVATSFEDIAIEVAALHELAQSVGELNLAAGGLERPQLQARLRHLKSSLFRGDAMRDGAPVTLGPLSEGV